MSNRDNARSGQAADREDINRQAGSKGQAANGQSKYAVQVNTGNQKPGETLRMLARGKQDFALGECLCAAFM